MLVFCRIKIELEFLKGIMIVFIIVNIYLGVFVGMVGGGRIRVECIWIIKNIKNENSLDLFRNEKCS